MGGGEIVRYLSRHSARQVGQAALIAAAVPFMLQTPDNPNGIDGTVFAGMKDGIGKDRPAFLAGLLRDVFYDVWLSSKVERAHVNCSNGRGAGTAARPSTQVSSTFSASSATTKLAR